MRGLWSYGKCAAFSIDRRESQVAGEAGVAPTPSTYLARDEHIEKVDQRPCSVLFPEMYATDGPVTTGGCERMVRASSCLLFGYALGEPRGEKGVFGPDEPHETDNSTTAFTAGDT